MLGIIGFSVPHLLGFVAIKDLVSASLIGGFDFALLAIALFVMIRFAIPAAQGKIALALDAEGIINYARNVTIPWGEIKDIDLRSSKTQSSLYITFKWETDHGAYIRVPLGYVKGDDEAIYAAVKEYFAAFGK
jgi:hypothetical protein